MLLFIVDQSVHHQYAFYIGNMYSNILDIQSKHCRYKVQMCVNIQLQMNFHTKNDAEVLQTLNLSLFLAWSLH